MSKKLYFTKQEIINFTLALLPYIKKGPWVYKILRASDYTLILYIKKNRGICGPI